jgi:uroporphyrinogen III methyltransferase/synthase
VVRLKGGDPFVFGRGGEEAEALKAGRLAFEIVPGVTSGVAVPAYAGIPVTHRDFTSSVTFVTGHEEPGKAASVVNWKALAELRNTLVMYMGVQRLEANLDQLMKHGLPADTPAAAIRWGSTPRQKQLVATVGTLAKRAIQVGMAAPAIIVIGPVVSCAENLAWFSTRPLFGKRVLITRTRRQAGKLRSLLEEQGAEVLEWPMIRIRPERPKDGWLEVLRQCDWIFFSSPNAVEAFHGVMEQNGLDARALAGRRIVAVGPSTGNALEAVGLHPDFMPGVYTAEGLVSGWLERYGNEGPRRIFFAAGSEAGPVLQEGLQAAGHAVERVHFYTTEPDESENTEARRLLDSGSVDWLVFNSSSAARAFAALDTGHAANLKWASFGPATSEALLKAGVEQIHCQAPESTLEALVEELVRVELTSSPPASH